MEYIYYFIVCYFNGGCTITGWTIAYYNHLFHKNPLLCLLIIGGILGCTLSIYNISGSLYLWWWIPLSTLFLGPVGLVLIALILPLIPWILYIILEIIVELN
ncbi:MAG: hypothetical protein ACFFEY_01525 [Candidatus Thorarchaeota archaeon]